MMRWLWALCVLAAATALLAADEKSAKDKNTVKVLVTSLNIYKAPPPKPGTFMMRSNGLNMEILISLPGRRITGIDAKNSKLERFTDDKDKALFKKSGRLFGGGPNWINEYGVRLDPDGESVAVQIQGTDAPGKDAGKILLKGSLSVKCGSDAKTTDAKEMALKPKAETDVGPFKARVGQFGNIEIWSNDENIQKVEFLDDKGKPILTGQPGRQRNPSKQEKLAYGYSYFLFGKHDKCSLKIHYFTRIETVKVPLDLRVGLGLE
jgi:hypothetical protein